MEFSRFGRRFSADSGIVALMDDLGKAMNAMTHSESEVYMLGGGNPASIPDVEETLRSAMTRLLETVGDFDRMMGHYDPPRGNIEFLKKTQEYFNSRYGWDLKRENIVITHGSQTSSFFLFNMLAGEFESGAFKEILLPVVPEYIGYCDQTLSRHQLRANRPEIQELDATSYKYAIDFNSLAVSDKTGLVCVSRPTNPTGNVLRNDEVSHLYSLTKAQNIPLIFDNAYGLPFPGMVFEEIEPLWGESIIHLFSLSKLGLPGVRTGIVIGPPEITEAIARMNAILNLATGTVGPTLASRLMETGEIDRLSKNVIRPFYEERSKSALASLHECFGGRFKYSVHKPEGSMFLWVWIRESGFRAKALYERLKEKNVIIVPGDYFFPGLQEGWEHSHQCFRVNYSQDPHLVKRGLQIIAEEITSL